MARYDKTTYTLRILGCTPETLPMSQLAKYLSELSNLLEGLENVHFESVTPGSACLNFAVEGDSKSKARARLVSVASDPKSTTKSNIRKLLRNNGHSGAKLYQGKMPVWSVHREFNRKNQVTVKKTDKIQGRLFDLGGKQERVRALIQGADSRAYKCHLNIQLAEKLKPYLWTNIQVTGDAEWSKDAMRNEWILTNFVIKDFTPLSSESLRDIFSELSQLPSQWTGDSDPHGDILKARH